MLIGGGGRYDVRMGKYFGLVVISALLLTGCASGESEAAPAPTVTVTATPEAAPIHAQAAPEETAAAGTFGNPEDDDFFIKGVEFVWQGERPTDEQFVSAAKLACEQMDSGAAWNTVQVTSGAGVEADMLNNEAIGQYAAQIYCPQHDRFTQP